MSIARNFMILVAAIFAAGTSCGPFLNNRDVGEVLVGYATDEKSERVVATDEAVDTVVSEVATLLKEHGFIDAIFSNSYGLQPWTGHTRHLRMHLNENSNILVYLEVSKKQFICRFSELETEVNTDNFSATQAQLETVLAAQETVRDFAQQRFSGRVVKVSSFHE